MLGIYTVSNRIMHLVCYCIPLSRCPHSSDQRCEALLSRCPYSSDQSCEALMKAELLAYHKWSWFKSNLCLSNYSELAQPSEDTIKELMNITNLRAMPKRLSTYSSIG